MLERGVTDTKEEWQDFDSFVASLPLENCAYRQIPITNGRGWIAPSGKAFQITGQFIVNSDQLDIVDWYGPNMSAELFRAEYADDYQNCLEKAKGNEKRAWELCLEGMVSDGVPAAAPISFTGKWLVISPELANVVPQKDQVPMILVKSDIQAWYEDDVFRSLDDLAPDSKTITSCLFRTDKAVYKWKQFYAEAILGYSQIILIDHPEVNEDLCLPNPNDNTLILPGGAGFWVQTARRTSEIEKQDMKGFTKGASYNYFLRESGLLVPFVKNRLVDPNKEELEKITKSSFSTEGALESFHLKRAYF